MLERSYAADFFFTGHAEESFTNNLDAVDSSPTNNIHIVRGSRGIDPVAPVFHNLDVYGVPLTLPAQSALGCAYAKCSFCTYPSIEPIPSKLSLTKVVIPVVQEAGKLNANVAIKDSLATPLRLHEIAECVQGRVSWSAYTKLISKLDAQAFENLQMGGLATLKVGLESLLVSTQRRISKIQSQSISGTFRQDTATTTGLSLIANYMTGFPWEDDT